MALAPRTTISITQVDLGRKKLLFREQTLKTSIFIVGSSFSGPGNEASD